MRTEEDTKVCVMWHTFSTLVSVKERPTIDFDFEHTEYRLVKPEELNTYDRVPGFVENVMELLQAL